MVDLARRTAKPPPRLVVVSGPPLVGATTIVKVLHEAASTKTCIVPDLDQDAIEEAFKSGCQVVFVEPFEPSVEAVQWLFDQRYASQADPGCIIRLWASDETLLKRAHEQKRSDVTRARLEALRAEWSPVEDRIRMLGIRHFSIPVGQEVSHAVAALARAIKLTT